LILVPMESACTHSY